MSNVTNGRFALAIPPKAGALQCLVLVMTALVAGAGTASAGLSAEVPIDVHEGHVYVSVALPNSEPLWFLVDSGAATPVNLIDKRAAERTGLHGEGQKTAGAIGGSVQLTFSPPVVLRVGALQMPAARLGIISLSSGEQAEGHPVDGILGFSFFRAFNPGIDYQRRRMSLSTSPMTKGNENAVPIYIIKKSCRVDGKIVLAAGQSPLPVKLVVDTGYDGGLVLNRPFVEKHNLLQAATGSVSGESLGGNTAGASLRIASLSIGTHVEQAVNARLSTDKEGAFSTSEVDGYIGAVILQHYSVLFDYKHNRLVMVPQKPASRP